MNVIIQNYNRRQILVDMSHKIISNLYASFFLSYLLFALPSSLLLPLLFPILTLINCSNKGKLRKQPFLNRPSAPDFSLQPPTPARMPTSNHRLNPWYNASTLLSHILISSTQTSGLPETVRFSVVPAEVKWC